VCQWEVAPAAEDVPLKYCQPTNLLLVCQWEVAPAAEDVPLKYCKSALYTRSSTPWAFQAISTLQIMLYGVTVCPPIGPQFKST
jgi:hypothetical protein